MGFRSRNGQWCLCDTFNRRALLYITLHIESALTIELITIAPNIERWVGADEQQQNDGADDPRFVGN